MIILSVLHIADNIYIRRDKSSLRVIVKVNRSIMCQEELVCPSVYADVVSGACSDYVWSGRALIQGPRRTLSTRHKALVAVGTLRLLYSSYTARAGIQQRTRPVSPLEVEPPYKHP